MRGRGVRSAWDCFRRWLVILLALLGSGRDGTRLVLMCTTWRPELKMRGRLGDDVEAKDT